MNNFNIKEILNKLQVDKWSMVNGDEVAEKETDRGRDRKRKRRNIYLYMYMHIWRIYVLGKRHVRLWRNIEI